MSKKDKAGGKKPVKQATNSELKSEDVLQAVILADSFDKRFSPITLEKPRALLPIVNIPLLHYTIELLAASGVQEIFVFCCAHASQLKEFLSESRWADFPGVRVKPIISQHCLSAGDALREVYSLSLINSDFILISGDVISNVNLQGALQAHKARREKDKSNIMTMLFKQTSPSHRTRSLEDDTILVIDARTQQLIQFENSKELRRVEMPTESFLDHPEVEFRYDLMDCFIDICSPEVLFLFTDNFDYQDLRKDFTKGLLSSEILGYKLSVQVLSGDYAARVKDLRTYNSVSKDIIHRWAYPMVPDNNFLQTTSYTMSRQMIYKEKRVKLSRSCNIGSETVIGEGTEIGDNSNIKSSVIGRNCKIGAGVTIEGAYLWDNVVVEDGAHITSSIVCDKARVGTNAIIAKGCILSFNVVVGANCMLPPFSSITACEDIEVEDDEEATADIDLGELSVGRLWILKADQASTLVPSKTEKEAESDSEPEEPEQEAEEAANPISEERKFAKEVEDTVKRGVSDNHSVDNIVLEINALKFAFDQTFLDCANAVLTSLLGFIAEGKESNTQALLAAVNTLAKKWGPLLSRFLLTVEDQVESIYTLEEYCGEEGEGYKVYHNLFQYILHALYDHDVLEEDAILQWADSLEDEENDDDKTFLKQCDKFLKWLREAEEDEEDDDDEEEEDDEEDDDDE